VIHSCASKWLCFETILYQFFTLYFLQHHTVILIVLIIFACAVYYPGESSFEVKIEADSNDITEHPHDDKPTIESRG